MARAGKHTSSQAVTPLRQARSAIPATLEQVCADLDKCVPGGSSGVTASMLSGWELGRHTTSVKYRTLLAEYYGQPPEVLFAHQDAQLATAEETPRLLVGHRDLLEAMIDVVERSENYLAIAGSRSRDVVYLKAIETMLAARPELVHYRVLFGPPRHADLAEHLRRLLEMRDPHDRSVGLKTLHIGVIADEPNTPERFFCASEHAAVVPIPSLTSADAFDSGVLLGAGAAGRLIDHARQCYAAARRVETPAAVQALPTPRSPHVNPGQGGQV